MYVSPDFLCAKLLICVDVGPKSDTNTWGKDKKEFIELLR